MRKTTPILALAVLAPLTLAACGGGRPAASPAVRPIQPISVSSGPDPTSGIVARGVGRISGTPDVLTLSIGVQTNAAHAADALGENSQKARAVADALKSNGVADKDIQTSQLSLSPHYTSSGSLSGYDVSNSVTAKLRDVGHAGQAIDAATAAAGDAGRLQGVSFSFDDDSALKAQARHDAVVHAKTQAQQLADAAGVKLGGLRSLSEIGQPTSWPVRYDAAAGAAATPSAAAVPVQAGTQELTVEVTVVYDVAS
jgi:uncharacterized protein YggE